MWFDSHCHLNLPGFPDGPEAVWAKARAGGVGAVFVPGTDPYEWSRSSVHGLPGVSTGVGLHPFTLETQIGQGASDLEDALEQLRVEATSGRHVAIGECGWHKPLTLRCPHLTLERQTRVVHAHLSLAAELDLPIVLHIVGAHGLALEVLRRYQLPRGGIVHCFSGAPDLVPLYCKMGFALGYGPQVLSANATKSSAALRATPRDQLLLETDAPFRAGSKHRLQNSPLAVKEVAKQVAPLLDLTLPDLARLTRANASRIFEVEASAVTEG